MTQPQRTYNTFKGHEIPLVCYAPREALVPLPEESDPGERGRTVWSHASITGRSAGCRVIYRHHTGLYYCTHPEHPKAGPKAGPCHHLQNTLFWLEYDRAVDSWREATPEELHLAETYFALVMQRGIVGIRGWEAESAALGDVIAERLCQAVAA